MNKFSIKRLILLAVSILVIVGMVNGSALAAATSKNLSTNFTLVNLSSSPAAVTVDYLVQGSGSAWTGVASDSKSFTLDGNGGQKQIRQYTDSTMVSGSGSAVVSSSQPLAAVVQIQARGQDPTTGAYVGVSKGSDIFYVPLVARNGFSLSGTFNSQIVVQNAGDSDVQVKIQMKPNNGYSGSPTITLPVIPKGASYYYDMSTEPQLTDNWFGSAVVSTDPSGGSIVVVANLFAGADGLQTFNAFPSSILTNKWVVPIFTSRLTNGLSTTVTFQNLSGGSLAGGDVKLECIKDGESNVSLTMSNPDSLADFASYSFNPASNMAYPANWFGACTVTAPTDKKIATFVQMRYIGASNGFVGIAAFEAIPANQQTTSFFVPLVAKQLSNGFATVVNIANLSSEATTVNLVYTPSSSECPVSLCDKNHDGSVTTADVITINNISIAGNAGNQRSHRFGEPDLPNGWIGTLKVTSTDGKYIGGVVQLTNIYQVKGDTQMAHDAFAQ